MTDTTINLGGKSMHHTLLKALLDVALLRAERNALKARLDAVREACRHEATGGAAHYVLLADDDPAHYDPSIGPALALPVTDVLALIGEPGTDDPAENESVFLVIDEPKTEPWGRWSSTTGGGKSNLFAGTPGRGKYDTGTAAGVRNLMEKIVRQGRKSNIHIRPDWRDFVQRARIEDVGRPVTTSELCGGTITWTRADVLFPGMRSVGFDPVTRAVYRHVASATEPVTTFDGIFGEVGGRFPPSQPLRAAEVVTSLAILVDNGLVTLTCVDGRPGYIDNRPGSQTNSLGYLDVVVAESLADASVYGTNIPAIRRTIKQRYRFPSYLTVNDHTVRSACFALVNAGIAARPLAHGRFYLAALAPSRWWQ